MSDRNAKEAGRSRLLWTLCGPAAFAVLDWLAAPWLGLEHDARVVLAVAVWIAVWWVFEVVPLAVTALLPLVLFPLTGVLSVDEASAPYADHIIFLFLGGFLIAGAVEESGLHKRIALRLVALTGSNPGRIVGGFMLAGAFLSMWISNSATAIMLLPVALAVARGVGEGEGAAASPEARRKFEKALLLAIAYATSVGGVGTLIGSPPNLVFAAAAERLFGQTVDFAAWLLVGVPIVVVLLPLAWLFLTRVAFKLEPRSAAGAGEHVRAELAKLGRLSPEERLVLLIFVATALAWIFRSSKELSGITVPGLDLLWPGIKDSTIAMAAAIALFVLPTSVKEHRPVLTWSVATKVPWGVILLFGGGLCLAHGFQESGLAEAFARSLTLGEAIPAFVTVAVVVAGTVALTELTSNTATAAMLMPLLAAAAVASGRHPLGFMMAGAVACSFAFCLPVATPPNAVVYGSGRLSIGDMVRAGLVMNVMAYVVWVLLFYFVAAPLLGIDPETLPDWALGGSDR